MLKLTRMIRITKVVSKDFISDLIAQVQNFFGWNLTAYEDMAEKAYKQIIEEILAKGYNLKWYRIETTQLTNGALLMTLYGECVD